jgi:large subunit ribosomal protein L14
MKYEKRVMTVGSIVRIADNSGPRFIRILKILKKEQKAIAKTGDFIIGSVLSTHSRKKFKVRKGKVVRGIVIRCPENFTRKDGQMLRFQKSAVVIVSRKGIPRGTKVYGPMPKELREAGYIRLISLGSLCL